MSSVAHVIANRGRAIPPPSELLLHEVWQNQGRLVLLALRVGSEGYLYPSWQLDPQSPDGLLPGLHGILADLREHDPVMQLAFFVNSNVRLGGACPLAEPRRGNVQAVHRAARTYGEQGAA